MRNPFPLDRGSIDSLGPWRATFRMSDLVASGKPWRGFLVTDAGMLGATEDARLWSVEEPLRGEPWLMGQDGEGVVHLVWHIATEESTCFPAVFRPLPDIGSELAGDEALLGAQAVSLARWHDLERFCGRCGNPVETIEAGWASRCTACQTIEYPRSDPAVIVRITDGLDRLLLAHNTAWAGARMSLPAGFVEAGETPRRAIEREMFEEVGLRVTDIEYLGAQPWPGPRSLMLAFAARVPTGVEPRVDGQEIDHARFFTREDYERVLTEGEVVAPGPSAVAHAMISEWLGKPLPSRENAVPGHYLSAPRGQ